MCHVKHSPNCLYPHHGHEWQDIVETYTSYFNSNERYSNLENSILLVPYHSYDKNTCHLNYSKVLPTGTIAKPKYEHLMAKEVIY